MMHAFHCLSQRTMDANTFPAMVDTDGSKSSAPNPTDDNIGMNIAHILESIRSLQVDLHNLDRTLQVLDQGSLLNYSVIAACTDHTVFTREV